MQDQYFSIQVGIIFSWLKFEIVNSFWYLSLKLIYPYFLFTGNEGDIEAFAQNTGFMWDIAEEFHAMLVSVQKVSMKYDKNRESKYFLKKLSICCWNSIVLILLRYLLSIDTMENQFLSEMNRLNQAIPLWLDICLRNKH